MERSETVVIPLGVIALGKAIRHYRRKAGLTQPELAQATGIVQQTISEYERAKAATIDADIMIRLSHTLGVNLLVFWRGGASLGELPLPNPEEIQAVRAA